MTSDEMQSYIDELDRMTNEKTILEDQLEDMTKKCTEWLSLLKYFYVILVKLVGRYDSAGYSREHIVQLTELDNDMVDDMIKLYKEEVEKAKQNEVTDEAEKKDI